MYITDVFDDVMVRHSDWTNSRAVIGSAHVLRLYALISLVHPTDVGISHAVIRLTPHIIGSSKISLSRVLLVASSKKCRDLA